LWPDGAPKARGVADSDRPALSVHLPDSTAANGAAVIIAPGGGYRVLASDHEGLQVARWLNRIGIAAFVLRYRVGPTYHSDISLLDAARAIRNVRQRAEEFGISPRRIGMLGFSAGGHLTVAAGTRFDAGDPAAAEPIDRHSSRPDFLVPVYAVTNGLARGRKADEYTPADTQVTADTPPTFLVHTHEDDIVSAEQSLLFYRACRAAGVPAELHVFARGEHGVGLGAGDPDVNMWTTLLQRWLRRMGLLTDRTRIRVEGRLHIDDRAPGMAWITLIPDDAQAPIARVRTYADGDGKFTIDSDHGPVPGPHTVEVHHVSQQHPYTNSGAYTLHDALRYTLRVDVRQDAALHLRIKSDAAGGND
jgi:acetyl esterase/lipase